MKRRLPEPEQRAKGNIIPLVVVLVRRERKVESEYTNDCKPRAVLIPDLGYLLAFSEGEASLRQDHGLDRSLLLLPRSGADVKAEDFDTVFYPGGHSPMWDLAESPDSIALLESFYNSCKPIALVCHSPGVLRHVTYQGAPLVKGKQVTGFTNGEEEEMHLTHAEPFLVEDELMRLGATFEKRADWLPFSVVDGRLIAGQNPASSTVAAQNLLNLLAAEKAA
jgi:putative intracellular protease/amidase